MCPDTEHRVMPIPAPCMPLGSPGLQVHPHQDRDILEVPLSGTRTGDGLGSAHAQGEQIPTLDVAQGLSAFLCLEDEQGSLQ